MFIFFPILFFSFFTFTYIYFKCFLLHKVKISLVALYIFLCYCGYVFLLYDILSGVPSATHTHTHTHTHKCVGIIVLLNVVLLYIDLFLYCGLYFSEGWYLKEIQQLCVTRSKLMQLWQHCNFS